MYATLKVILKALIPDSLLTARQAWQALRPMASRECNICGYHGQFRFAGRPPRLDARCPRCESLERHRLFWKGQREGSIRMIEPIIHFAPESILEQKLRSEFKDYRTADLFEKCDLKLNLEVLDLPDASIGTFIANHVLEHVDDRKSLLELWRALKPGGVLICSVPLIDGWSETYEKPSIRTEQERELHFGQFDHIRYYGNDIRDRFREAGFQSIAEIVASPAECARYGLIRGERIFTCKKDATR